MKTTLVFAGALLVCGCGGTEGTIPDGGLGMDGTMPGTDSGGNDTGTMDDTGTDSGMNGDGGGMDGGGNDAGNFDPKSVSCLVMWLDAAKGITQNNTFVSAWADQTANGNNAAQNTGSRQPAIAMNVINGLPALHFNAGQQSGNMMLVVDSPTTQFGTGDFAIWTVARFNNNPNGGVGTGAGVFVAKVPQQAINFSGPFLVGNYFTNNTAATGLHGGVSNNNILNQANTYNDNMPRAYAFRRTGTSLELRVNGAAVQTAMQNGNIDVSATSNPTRIGANGDANLERLNGDIAEILFCKGAISSQDLAGMDGYLKAKYGL